VSSGTKKNCTHREEIKHGLKCCVGEHTPSGTLQRVIFLLKWGKGERYKGENSGRNIVENSTLPSRMKEDPNWEEGCLGVVGQVKPPRIQKGGSTKKNEFSMA